MNLYEQLNLLYYDSRSYYYPYNYSDYKNPIINPRKAYKFIEEYFVRGAKERVFDAKYISEMKKYGKNFHTVDIYFLGILFRPLFDNRIEIELNKMNYSFANLINYKFTYTWFLTSLYHDTAWIIEKNTECKTFQKCSTKYVSNYVNSEYEISNNLFQHNWINNNPIKYSEELVYNYLHYSVSVRERIEHGILGGLILFDRLKKNYSEKWNEYCNENTLNGYKNTRFSFDNFEYKGLSWKREHIDHFGYVSNAIISHNIWINIDEALYKRFSLDELIEGRYNRLNIKDNPLIYLLALVDTIEPTKYFSTVNTKVVLESISIDIDVDLKKIDIHVNDKILNYLEWFKEIKKLEKWLEIDINCSENKISIDLNVL